MNLLDLIIGVILILFALAGLRKGLIIEAFYLASIVIGIYGAMFFSDVMAEWISELINVKEEYLALIAFILTFIVFMILIRFLGRVISNLISTIHLGFIDKIGGIVFGLLKGALLVSVLIMVLNIFGISDVIDEKTKDKSILYGYTEQIANVIYKNQDMIKDSMEKSFEKGIDVIEDVIETSLTK
jgi:membrane protein required for colicin V production